MPPLTRLRTRVQFPASPLVRLGPTIQDMPAKRKLRQSVWVPTLSGERSGSWVRRCPRHCSRSSGVHSGQEAAMSTVAGDARRAVHCGADQRRPLRSGAGRRLRGPGERGSPPRADRLGRTVRSPAPSSSPSAPWRRISPGSTRSSASLPIRSGEHAQSLGADCCPRLKHTTSPLGPVVVTAPRKSWRPTGGRR